jgi:hypothetical protein
MTAKDTVLSGAVNREDVPFVVGMVANAASPTYSGVFGENVGNSAIGQEC